MQKYYTFFLRDTLPKSEAHIGQVVQSANAAANLGFPVLLLYLKKGWDAARPIDWIAPFQPAKPDRILASFYNIQERLEVLPLSMPWPIDTVPSKFTSSSTFACKYYLPVHLRHRMQIAHSRDWNFVKAAVRNGIPAIYEHHHIERKQFEPEIVHHPCFQVAVTVADSVLENLLENGMPAKKAMKLHNGFSQLFYLRHPQQAREWRQKLISGDRTHLVVYSGSLYKFKGIDLLLDVAQELPQAQFALAGGPDSQIQAYQQEIRERQLSNVTLVGCLPQSELAGLLQAADVLVNPHLSGEAANFTSPLKLFDYMAAGKPIVATQIPPLKEFESSPLIAGWCEPDDPTAFSSCLQEVLARYPQWQEESLHP
ncbi:MAG: glycosyltransferase, partial [Cyanobacteriota bacterium]|nr:glycosyltransferase [Cyanobacteriota bacterium]